MLEILPFTPGQTVTSPGLYAIDEAIYHADAVCEGPTLSSSVARTLLNGSPLHAWHKHPRLNVTPDEDEADEAKTTMDVGRALHAMLLGSGAEIAVVNAKDWRTKAAKEKRDDARAAGQTPMLLKDFDRANKLVMRARAQIHAIKALPNLLGRDTIFEHVAVWQEQGVWCRAMLDILRVYPEFVAIFDFKSTERSAAPATLGRQVFSMGYDVQLAFYRRGIRRLIGPDAPPIRCFIASQERHGPGALAIVELDQDVLALADKKVAAALSLWETCLTRDEWPAYPPFIGTVTLPPLIEQAWLDREVADDTLAEAGYRFALPLPDSTSRVDPTVLRAG